MGAQMRWKNQSPKMPHAEEVPPDPLEEANKASTETFLQRFLKPDPSWPLWKHPASAASYTLSFLSAGDLTRAEHHACFEIIRATSEADYRASTRGWHPREKRAEMQSPGMRYVLVQDRDDGIKGFLSLLPETVESGESVVYCYEIHLLPELQGTGLGRQLMGCCQAVAENIGLCKVMLTCFRRNKRALRFYERMGFEADGLSPRQWTLRSGRVVEPDYVILSWRTGRDKGI